MINSTVIIVLSSHIGYFSKWPGVVNYTQLIIWNNIKYVRNSSQIALICNVICILLPTNVQGQPLFLAIARLRAEDLHKALVFVVFIHISRMSSSAWVVARVHKAPGGCPAYHPLRPPLLIYLITLAILSRPCNNRNLHYARCSYLLQFNYTKQFLRSPITINF